MAASGVSSPAPERSSVRVVAIDEIENDAVRVAAEYWRMLKPAGGLPARSALSPREMSGFLRNIVLLKVIDGGADYEYRIAGDVHVQAYGLSFKDLRISHIIAASPDFGTMMRGVYEHVRGAAEPFAVRGWVGRDVPDARFVYYESLFLPLAEDGKTVDHILIVSTYIPKPGI